MSQYYQHSGTVPIGGAIRTMIEGLAAATFLAIIYSYAINYIPIVYANIVGTLGFGAIIGWLVAHESKSTKIRNSVVPALIGLICGLAGLYVAWAVDLKARGGVPGLGLFGGLDPTILIPYIQWFYENGAWGIGKGGGVVSGIPLGIVWLVEAGMIVGLATSIPWGAYKTNVFCEPCDQWTEQKGDVLRLNAGTADDVVARLTAGDFASLQNVPLAEPGADTFLRLKLDSCDSCEETNCLGVDQVTITVDKEGKPTEKTRTLINRMLISRGEVELLHSLAAPAPAEAEPESAEDASATVPGESPEPA